MPMKNFTSRRTKAWMRIAPQLGFREEGIHAEAEQQSPYQRACVGAGEDGLRNQVRVAGFHGGDARADTARRHQHSHRRNNRYPSMKSAIRPLRERVLAHISL